MGQSYDGTFTSPVQHGSKQLSIPLQTEGNNHATIIRRNYIAAPYAYYEPVIGTQTAYTALLKYSDDLSQSNWTKAAATGTANAATDPDGGATATKLAEDNTNAAHNASQAMTVAAGALSFGVLAKAGERTQFRLRVYNATDGSLGSTVFNLSTGVITSGTGSIKKLLKGWYFCSVQVTPSVTNSTAFVDLTNDGSTFSYAGTTGSGVYLWRLSAYLASAIGPVVATTAFTRAFTSLPVDADDPQAFLISEMEPDQSSLELGVARWVREYANVPRAIAIPTTTVINKPALSGTYSTFSTGYYGGLAHGDYRIIKPTNSIDQYDVYKAAAITVDSGAPAFYPTAGTYTLSFGGLTTAALAFNATVAQICTELNLLASIAAKSGVVTTSGAYNDPAGVNFAFSGFSQITLDATALTGTPLAKIESLQNNGTTQLLKVTRAANPTPITSISVDSITVTSGGSKHVNINYTDSNRPALENAYRFSVFWQGPQGTEITGGTFTITVAGFTTSAISIVGNFATIIAACQSALDAVLGAGVCVVSHWPDLLAYYGQAFMDAAICTGPIGPNTWQSFSAVITFIPGGATGGTFTITSGTTSAAIAYNASLATISAAINGLSTPTTAGGVVVTGSLIDGLSIVFSYGQISVTSSLTPSGSTATISNTDSPVSRKVRIVFAAATAVRTIYAPLHGINSTDSQIFLGVTAGAASALYGPVVNFLVIDGNTIQLPIAASNPYASISSFAEVCSLRKLKYSSGSAIVKASRTINFYLPGYTPGILTASDIPIPQNQGDGIAFLLALLSNVGTFTMQVGALSRWRNSDILMLETLTVDAIDI